MSKLLTGILIVMIIFVVGAVAYYTFNYFRNKKINENALKEIEEFDRNIPTLTLAEYEDLVKKELIKEDDESTNNQSSNNQSSNQQTQYNGSDLDAVFAVKTVGTIRIPKTSVKYSIYSPAGEKALEQGIGMLATTNGLNREGNTTLQGHNWRNWMFFSRNNLLAIGDSVYIKDKRGVEIEYIIYKKMVLNPSDSKYIIRDTLGKREISLSTCTNEAKDRLVILAREK